MKLMLATILTKERLVGKSPPSPHGSTNADFSLGTCGLRKSMMTGVEKCGVFGLSRPKYVGGRPPRDSVFRTAMTRALALRW